VERPAGLPTRRSRRAASTEGKRKVRLGRGEYPGRPGYSCTRSARSWDTSAMVYGADYLGAWLVAVLAEAGRKKIAEFVLSTDQERLMRSDEVWADRARSVTLSHWAATRRNAPGCCLSGSGRRCGRSSLARCRGRVASLYGLFPSCLARGCQRRPVFRRRRQACEVSRHRDSGAASESVGAAERRMLVRILLVDDAMSLQ
jgi:hypothetical protein